LVQVPVQLGDVHVSVKLTMSASGSLNTMVNTTVPLAVDCKTLIDVAAKITFSKLKVMTYN